LITIDINLMAPSSEDVEQVDSIVILKSKTHPTVTFNRSNCRNVLTNYQDYHLYYHDFSRWIN